MKRFSSRAQVVLLLAFVLQVVASQAISAQRPNLQAGSRAQVVPSDPNVEPFEGTVTQTWQDGFAIEVRGEPTPRRVDFADVESLQRSLRLGTQAKHGAIIGGAAVGVTGFIVGYCFNLYGTGCFKDLRTGAAGGLVGAGIGALVGGGIGILIGRYGPWETVDDLGGPTRSADLDRVTFDVAPQPDGRIGLGVTLRFGGGS